jgi:Ni/Co efflux regulator RcnB
MKRLLCAVAVIALMAPTAAISQTQNTVQNRSGPGRHQGRPATGQPQNRPSRPAGERPNMRPSRPATRPASPTGERPNTTHPRTRPTRPAGERPNTRPSRPTTRETTRVYQPGHRPSSYHRIRAPAFRYPRGYSYRRWRTGSILPRLFLSSIYFWTDWAALGLLPPPPGYVWVRFGPDLLLVNRYTGRIADVIYGAFY